MAATDLDRPASSPLFTTAAASRFMDAIEATVGGREALIESLLSAPPSTDLDYVVGLIAHPLNDCRKLATICAQGNVTVGEFLSAAKAGMMGAAVAKAIMIAAAKVPEITQDVVTRALVHEASCPACNGRTTIITFVNGLQMESPCLTCRGTGRTIHEPLFDAQKLVLEKMAGFGAVSKGPLLQQNIDNSKHLTFDVSQQAHAKLLAAADKVLYGKRDAAVIDVDPIVPSPTPE